MADCHLSIAVVNSHLWHATKQAGHKGLASQPGLAPSRLAIRDPHGSQTQYRLTAFMLEVSAFVPAAVTLGGTACPDHLARRQAFGQMRLQALPYSSAQLPRSIQ